MEWLEENIGWLVTGVAFFSLIGIQISPIKINPFNLLKKLLKWCLKPFKNWIIKEINEQGCHLGEEYRKDSERLKALEERINRDMLTIFGKMESLLVMTQENKVDRLFDNIRIIKKMFVECDEQLINKNYLTREQYKQIFKYEDDYNIVREKLKKFPEELVPREAIPNGEVKPMLKKFHDAYQKNLIK